MEPDKSLTPTYLLPETSESLMNTQEDLKLHLDTQDETELFISKLHEWVNNSQRTQENYENLIETLYKKLNTVISENKSLSDSNSRLQSSLKSLSQDYSQKLELTQKKCQEKILKYKETLNTQVKSLNQSTISAISAKLHTEYAILKKSAKTAYKEKLKKKQKKWVEKFQSLDNFYQESLRSIQLLHSHRLSDSAKQTESLLQKFLNPSTNFP